MKSIVLLVLCLPAFAFFSERSGVKTADRHLMPSWDTGFQEDMYDGPCNKGDEGDCLCL